MIHVINDRREITGNRQPCDVSTCNASSFAYLHKFKNRTFIEQHHFCHTHLQEICPKLLQLKTISGSIPESEILVDIDWLYCPLDDPWRILCLRAADYDCTMNVWVRKLRALEIRSFGEFKKTANTIYDVFSTTVASLGASLDNITVNSCEGHGSATLELSSPSLSVKFPRAEDAIMFALVASLPIYATEHALREATATTDSSPP